MPLIVVDGNNHFRRRAEVSANPIRELFEQSMATVDPLIYVWDGANSLSARRKIFPGYKSKRTPAAESIYESQKLFKQVLTLSRAVQVEVPGYEADDVIAAIVTKAGSGNCHIMSNDADLWQLGATMDRDAPKIESRWMRLYKATVGDPSDAIPGIKGFGAKGWDSVNKEILDQLVRFGMCMDKLDQIGLSKATANWLRDDANLTQVRIYYEVVGFLPIPDELISKHTHIPALNPEGARAIMAEFML